MVGTKGQTMSDVEPRMEHRRAGEDARRFAVLDAWRGVCAVMVVLLHAPISGPFAALGLVRHGWLFVDFFFVLSGFVIAHAYAHRLADREGLERFARSRIMRVYPLHVFMLLLFALFETALLLARGSEGGAFAGNSSPGSLVLNLLMLHGLGTVNGLGWNYPSWSISAELFAYLVFAVLATVAGRRSAALFAALAALSATGLALAVGHLDTTVAFGWLRCLFGFSCGVVLRTTIWSRSDKRADPRDRLFWTVAEIATVAAVGTFVAEAGATPASLAAPFVFAYAIFLFAHEGGAVSALLRRRLFAVLGMLSYSIYMTHAFVISRVINAGTLAESRLGLALTRTNAEGMKLFVPDPLVTAGVLAAILLATLAFSALTWRFVEVPGQRAGSLRRRANQVRPSRQQPA